MRRGIYRLFSCALEIEAEPIIKYLNMSKVDKYFISEIDNDEMNFKFHKFINSFQMYISVDKCDILVITGVGKNMASIANSYLLNLFNVSEIINIGLCGSINSSYKKGDIVRVHKVCEHDMYLPDNLSFMNKNIPINIDIYYKITSNEVRSNFSNVTLCTGDKFVDDNDYKISLIRKYNADIVDMEGYSVAKCARIFGVNLRMYKIVSDNADEKAAQNFKEEDSISDLCNKSINFLMTKI